MSYERLAKVYDRFAYDFDYDAWANWYIRILTEKAPHIREIVDCGCGTGSLAVRLAKRGYRVTGTDLSEDMLREAQNKARRYGVRIPFIRQDMRFLELTHPTDAIFCACDGVNYLLTDEDAQTFFRAAFRWLKSGGAFAFDVSNQEKLSDTGLYAEDMEEQTYLWQNTFDAERRLLTMDITFFVRGSDGRYDRFSERHTQRAYTARELRILLEQAGFEEIEIYGADAGEGSFPGGKRIYMTAKKP